MRSQSSLLTPKVFVHKTSNPLDHCAKSQGKEIIAPEERTLQEGLGWHEEINRQITNAEGTFFTGNEHVDVEINENIGTWSNVYEDGNTNINSQRDRFKEDQFTRIESFRVIIGALSVLILVIITLISINAITYTRVMTGVSVLGFLCILDTIFSNSFSFLLGTMEKEKAEILLNQIEAAAPVVRWQIRCYHYETTARVLSNDDGVKVTDTIRQRVNTWHAEEFFKFRSWCGIPTPPIEVIKSRLTKIKLVNDFCFDNAATEAEFQRQKMVFQLANNRDTHQEISESFDVPGFEDTILCEDRKGCMSKLLSLPYHLFFHLMFLSPYYQWWVSFITERKTCHIVRTLSIDCE